MHIRRSKSLLFLALVAVLTAPALAQQSGTKKEEAKKETRQFLRITRDAKQVPQALEVAIVRCRPTGAGDRGPTVDLISAVHVADKAYYKQLNREFGNYDAVLYELVAPKDTKVPKGGTGSSGNPVSLMQKLMKDVLELEFQLDEIDYTRDNMVHADMSPEQFAESMKSRGESVFTIFLRMMGYAIARQNQKSGTSSDLALLAALFDKNRALALKKVMAEQFEDMEGMLTAMEGPEGSTLISERNKVALEVLRKQLSAKKRKLAIFYGGGHMPDMLKRLQKDFGLEPVSTRWLVAWKLEP